MKLLMKPIKHVCNCIIIIVVYVFYLADLEIFGGGFKAFCYPADIHKSEFFSALLETLLKESLSGNKCYRDYISFERVFWRNGRSKAKCSL